MTDRPKGTDLRILRRVLSFLKPYRVRVAAALVALLTTTGTTLALGQGLRLLVDRGFAAGNAEALNLALLGLVLLSVILSAASLPNRSITTPSGEPSRVTANFRISG